MLKYKQKAGKQSWQEVSGMKINEVSKMYDITADTLRYYERIGLIPAVNRNESGIRDYTETDCNWVKLCQMHARSRHFGRKPD